MPVVGTSVLKPYGTILWQDNIWCRKESEPTNIVHIRHAHTKTTTYVRGGQIWAIKDLICSGLSLQQAPFLFFDPSIGDPRRSITGIAEKSLRNGFVPGSRFAVEFAHAAMISFNAHALNALDVGCGRVFVHDHFTSGTDASCASFVEEVDVEATCYICELGVDILQELVVGLERLDKVGGGVHEFLGENRAADALQQVTPFCHVGAIMGGSKKEDTISGHIDRA